MNKIKFPNSVILSILIILIFASVKADVNYNELTIPVDTSGFIEVDNGQLYFEASGEGDVILFLHDGSLNLESWNFQFPHFSKDYKVIRYDRRGYGRSSKGESQFSDVIDLESVFEQLGIEKATLIGCSAGGRLSIDFALKHPNKVKTMILVGPVISGFPFTPHFYNRGGKLPNEYYQDNDKFVEFWYTQDPYSIYEENTEAQQFAYNLLMKYPHNLAFSNFQFRSPPERPAIGALSEILIPTLLIAGENDIADVHAHIGALDAGLPNSKRVIINKAGHLAHIEHPEQINNLIDGFFDEQAFYALLDRAGVDKTIETYKQSGQLNPESFPISEFELNELGYRYLFSNEIEKALALFKVMVSVYNESANAYDSYGEGLKMAGRNEEAIINLKKSLELNPENEHAKQLLEELEN
jgi:pimeloyl-ACP methyl ester carboxylesterase